MSAWEAITVAAQTGKAAYDLAEELGLWKKWQTWLRKKRKILVLGASGTGKTQLVNSIANPLSEKLDVLQRTVTVERRSLLIGKSPFVFSDTPGQILDEAKRKVAITDAVRQKIDGVLNVVSYGYHEAAEADKSAAIPESGGHIARADYLEERREIEVALLSEWIPFFDIETAKWILTIVTKADLWWPERARPEKHYQEGSYAEALGEFKQMQTVLPYCSRIEPFYGTKTSGKFGESLKVAFRNHLIDSLLRLSGIDR